MLICAPYILLTVCQHCVSIVSGVLHVRVGSEYGVRTEASEESGYADSSSESKYCVRTL